MSSASHPARQPPCPRPSPNSLKVTADVQNIPFDRFKRTKAAVRKLIYCLCSGDTRALCDDMKDFAHDYIDYGNMAKLLTPETNRVQHWSKIIETK